MSQLIFTLLIVLTVCISTTAIASEPDLWEVQRTYEQMLTGPQYQQDQRASLKAEVGKFFNQWILDRRLERRWKVRGTEETVNRRD
ncbi:MAG: hypothetical protein ACP5U1_13800 [Desulfomonilaceae bacterium]